MEFKIKERDFEIDAASAEEGNSGRITLGFNLALFTFVSALGVLRFVLANPGVNASGLVFSSLLDALRYLVVLLISAAFLQVFWKRLVTTTWAVRAIDFGESSAILLMIALIFGT